MYVVRCSKGHDISMTHFLLMQELVSEHSTARGNAWSTYIYPGLCVSPYDGKINISAPWVSQLLKLYIHALGIHVTGNICVQHRLWRPAALFRTGV